MRNAKFLAVLCVITSLFIVSCEKKVSKSDSSQAASFVYTQSCLNGSWYEDTLHERSRFRDYFYRINDAQLSVIDKENNRKETFYSYYIYDGKTITISPLGEVSKKISSGTYPISIIDENRFTIHFPSPMKFVRNDYAHAQADKLAENLQNASEVAMFISAATGTAATAAGTARKISSKSAKAKSTLAKDSSLETPEIKSATNNESIENRNIARPRNVKVGDTKQDYVYRVIRPDEDPHLGLHPKNPDRNMTVEGHIVSGSRNNGSQYISTTTDYDVALQYAERDGCRIVKIDLNKVPDDVKIYDLSTQTGRETYLKGRTANNFATASKEVLLEGDIPASAIELVE